MKYSGLIAAGFGGQGVMLLGQLLSYAAMLDGKFTTWLPSYGPEMRGGTANCTVVISDEYIASPVIDAPTELLAFNLPSMNKFVSQVIKGGSLIINSSVVESVPERKDIKIFRIPANDIAEKHGNIKVQNMVMMGAFLHVSNIVSMDAVQHAFEHKLTGTKAKLIDLNMKAIESGMVAAGK